MADIKTKYKRYNGTDFDTIYFKTTADQVLNVTDGKTDGDWRGVLTPYYTINGQHWTGPATNTAKKSITIKAEHVPFAETAMDNDFAKQFQGGTVVQTAIEWVYGKVITVTANLKTIQDAYGNGTIITTSNMNSKITKVGKIDSGTWNGTAIADAYIASASKWNGYGDSKQDKLTFDTTLSSSTTNVPRSSAVKTYVDNQISTVTSIAQGKTKTYVIDPNASKDGDGVTVVNGSFLHGKTDKGEYYTISDSDSKIYTTDEKTISLSSLKVGDIILTTGSKVKDYFLAVISGHDYTFYQIDSDTPDLTGYALKSSLGTAASKNVSTSGPSANSANLVTEAQVKSFVEGQGYIKTYVDTTYTFATGSTNGAFSVTPKGGSTQSVKVCGLAAAAYKGVDTAAFATSSTSANVPTTAAVASTIKNRATKIYYGSTTPTGMNEGDVWIDTAN